MVMETGSAFEVFLEMFGPAMAMLATMGVSLIGGGITALAAIGKTIAGGIALILALALA